MEFTAQPGPPVRSHPNPNHCQRARASPPPDPEMGNGHYCHHPPPPQLSAQAMQPPRLNQTSCCSRFLLLSGCCLCLLIVLAAWTLVLNLPFVVETRRAIEAHVAPQTPVPKRPLPAVLHRFATIRRTRTGKGRGADEHSLRQAFPHWRGTDGQLQMEAVVGDMAMGLASVVEQLEPSLAEARMGVDPALAPPPVPEPPAPYAPPGEDLEL